MSLCYERRWENSQDKGFEDTFTRIGQDNILVADSDSYNLNGSWGRLWRISRNLCCWLSN
ncbi:hypothetical protein [Anaerosporobacter sp.]|uniref:hypothetical protein n=1 Tax=Anaerosporobacter sp. TaxID=1872529 RepID=UPI00286F88F9|nr:hypothetical protein [Anaerosporobacter sp.]